MILMQVMYAVCSGSEANDLALRIARANRPGEHTCCMSDAFYCMFCLVFNAVSLLSGTWHAADMQEVCCLMSHPMYVFALGAWHVAVVEGAYHGHTTATLDLSPYKFDGPGGLGKPPHVHVLPCPDVLRYGFSVCQTAESLCTRYWTHNAHPCTTLVAIYSPAHCDVVYCVLGLL